MGENSRQVGKAYEDLAISYLEDQGCQILDRNFYIRGGEIDIIAKDKEVTVFVEVKYRKNDKCGGPYETISIQKQKRISKTALHYIAKKNIPLECPFRFDVIMICGNDIKWLKNAFSFSFNGMW